MNRRAIVAILAATALAACTAVSTPSPRASPSGPPYTDGPPTTPLATPSAGPFTSGSLVGDRYPDGLPRTFGGSPVIRGPAAIARAAAATDESSFLVTGWVTYVPGARFCALTVAPWSWRRDCNRALFSDVAGASDPTLTDAITFTFIADQLLGPVVVSVHVHDPRAPACGIDASACDQMMVVERILWAGDEATAPHPLAEASVQRVLGALQKPASLTPLGMGVGLADCGGNLPAASFYLVAVPQVVRPIVTSVNVEPTPDALRRALGVGPGPSASLGAAARECWSVIDGSWSEDFRWLVVENVALMVRTHHGPTSADRAFLTRLFDALEQTAAAVGG